MKPENHADGCGQFEAAGTVRCDKITRLGRTLMAVEEFRLCQSARQGSTGLDATRSVRGDAGKRDLRAMSVNSATPEPGIWKPVYKQPMIWNAPGRSCCGAIKGPDSVSCGVRRFPLPFPYFRAFRAAPEVVSGPNEKPRRTHRHVAAIGNLVTVAYRVFSVLAVTV
jgi:hypothetical protein